MKCMNIITVAASLTLATAAYAQSSKFAATYDTDIVMIDVDVDGSCVTPPCTASAGPVAEAELAKLHVGQWHEILGIISGQINLVTFTQAKGKNKAGTSTAVAEGSVRAGILVLPTGPLYDADTSRDAFDGVGGLEFAPPGPVILASRRQELTVDVDLDVVGALDGCDEACIAASLGIEGDVTVALGLDTTAGHTFQFIAADLLAGSYDILACYDLSAFVSADGADIDADTMAHSMVALGPRILTAQEVRATKDGIIDESTP